MNRRPFTTSPAYVQSLRDVHWRHAVRVPGRPTLSEEVGDDEGWLALSPAERERLIGLDEDLGSIHEAPADRLPMNDIVRKQLVHAFEARQAGQWDRALELFRLGSAYMDAALLAYLRGTIWMEAGDPATAGLFFQRATELDPANPTYANLGRYTRSVVRRAAARALPAREPVAPVCTPSSDTVIEDRASAEAPTVDIKSPRSDRSPSARRDPQLVASKAS